jgi:hypothetical protein
LAAVCPRVPPLRAFNRATFTQVLAGPAFGGFNNTVGKLVNFGTARQMQPTARFTF